MSTVFYTQDMPGERDWLKNQFPGIDMRETYSSNKWDNLTDNSAVEIPFTDNITVAKEKLGNIDFSKTIKSVFKQLNIPELEFGDNGWMLSKDLIINENIKFDNQHNSLINSYKLFTFGRSGSVFAESILQQQYKQHGSHCIHPGYQNLLKEVECLEDTNTMVVLLYRQNWWDWVAATSIIQKFGKFHYDTIPDLRQLKTFTLTKNKIDHLQSTQISIFNFWCNLRLKFPKKTFKLYRYEDIVDINQHRTDHKKIKYHHSDLIENYAEVRDLFLTNYEKDWKATEELALKHLNAMGVTPIHNGIL
jgi:hypothetical protein